ncbi:MAG: N-acetylmuramoyl-L-alanine amidase [Eubacterium sp.]|nr:N-acetylmuramoyl-L-alanine amidase [Eubacterium sp.]
MSRKYHYYKKRRMLRWIGCIILLAAIVVGIIKVTDVIQNIRQPKQKVITDTPQFDVDLLTVNEYSRPGIERSEINGIVIHYTANPGSTAKQNRDYFEGLKDSKATKASSHFIVGIDGEIIQCVPTAELAYASNDRNVDTISIECCHPDETGKYTDATYESLVELVAWLCGKFQLDTQSIIRHYDVTGKACPLYFVEHEDAWIQFKQDVQDYIGKYGEKIE